MSTIVALLYLSFPWWLVLLVIAGVIWMFLDINKSGEWH